MCSVLVSTHVFKNELCQMCGVLVLTHGTTRLPENELCYMCVACLFRLMVLRTSYVTCVPCLFRLTVLRTSNVICDVLVLTHGTTRLPETPSESMCFQWIRWTPSDDFEPSFRFHLMTRLPVTRVDSTVLPVSFFDQTPLDSRFCPLESSRE